VSQTLFATKSISEMLLEELPDTINPRVAQYAQQIVRLSKAATSELRMLLLEMRPNALEQTDIVTLLRLLCDSFTGNTEVPVDLMVPDKLFLPKDIRLSFYRVVQEALNNITRYAGASHVTIELDRDNGSTTLCIRDDGRGFDPDKVPSERLGIKLMHEHAAHIGAQLEIHSSRGKGTQVLLRSVR
jgi:signal transduction histidine kinase